MKSKKKTTRAKAAAEAVIASEAELWSLTMIKLRQLARSKNVLNRSKCKQKDQLVQALTGIITRGDLRALGIPINQEPEVIAPALGIPASLPSPGNPAAGLVSPMMGFREGVRINGAVMGIDVHQECLTYCIIDAYSPDPLSKGEFFNTQEGITELLALCQTWKVQSVGMESTADYWRKVYWRLSDAHYPVLVANALQTKTTQGDKTDPRDARRIALAHRDGRLRPSICCTQQQFVLRKTLRAALKMTEKGTTFANQLRAYEHLADAPKWVKNLSKSAYGRELLIRLDTFADVHAVVAALQDAHPSWKASDIEAKAGQVWHYYQTLQQMGLWTLYLDRLANLLYCKQDATRLFSAGIRALIADPANLESMEILLTTSCIGVESAAVMVAEIGDITRFEKPEGLVRWMGLNPSVSQSGRYKNRTGPITKKGDKYLRKVFYSCAQNDYVHGLKPGHPLGAKLRFLKEVRKKPYKKAIVAGARKLVTWIWMMLTKKEAFKMQAPEEIIAKFRDAAAKKIQQLHQRIVSVSQVAEATLDQVVKTIREYKERDLATEFTHMYMDAIQHNPNIDVHRLVLPVSALVGLSNAYWEINQT